jgi:hypothetical protein
MGVVAAIRDAALIGPTRHNITVVAGIRIAPLPRNTRLTALESVVFRFLGVAAVAFVQAFANFAADDAADNSSSDRRGDVSLAGLVADKATSNATEDQPRALIVYSALTVAAANKHSNRH